MKKHLTTVILILVFLTGLSLLLYPTVSDYWNSFRQSRAITDYDDSVAKLDKKDYDDILIAARKYNKELYNKTNRYSFTAADQKYYESQLDVSGNGIMGYIEIKKINTLLPIYHGINEDTLQIAVGHIVGTSLPVGGTNTHCVLSGHRGLPSAKLFTNLDKLVEGDTFTIKVLNETLTYEVDQIRIVLPEQVDDLAMEEGKDLCTLVTCTPYGVNTHRLLVRGHRIENPDDSTVLVTADALQIEPIIVASVIAVPILSAFLIWILVKGRKSKKNKTSGVEETSVK